jgi:hypothetical protein
MWLDWFIIRVAGAFEVAGGNPSAATQGLEGEDGKRRRETPFLRVLRFIHERLPAARRASSDEALAERADRVFAIVKRARRGKNRK